MSDKKIDKYLSIEDRKKIRDRKERIQHPYLIKSRLHWDWDMGYDIEENQDRQNEDDK